MPLACDAGLARACSKEFFLSDFDSFLSFGMLLPDFKPCFAYLGQADTPIMRFLDVCFSVSTFGISTILSATEAQLSEWVCTTGTVVKMLAGMPGAHTGVSGFGYLLQVAVQLPANVLLGRQQVTGQILEVQRLPKDTWIEFWSPGYGLAQIWLL